MGCAVLPRTHPKRFRMMSRRFLTAACALTAALFAGCGKPTPPPIVEAGGVIRLNGKPLKKAAIRLLPTTEYGAEYYATGVTDDQGRYKLTCHGQSGACACENRVIVVESDIPPKLLGEEAQLELQKYLRSLGPRPPPRYADLTSSPLSVTVSADRAEYNFDLEP
jgi:hypothetical protein